MHTSKGARVAAMLFALAMLAGCGGGGEPPPANGATSAAGLAPAADPNPNTPEASVPPPITAPAPSMESTAPATPSAFGGARLQDLAPAGFAIGAVVQDYSSFQVAAYRDLVNQEFNAVTATSFMAYDGWPQGPLTQISTKALNGVTDWARGNGKRVHGHVLLYPQTNLDATWFQALPLNQVAPTLERYITAMAKSSAGKVWVWDVVNEAFSDPGDIGNTQTTDENGLRKGQMINGQFKPYKEYSAMGADYIAQAFRWAKLADPAALLIINDYGAEEINAKSDKLLAFVKKLRAQGVPIDGVGLQSHFDINSPPNFDSVRANLKRFADSGFQVFLTEVDVSTARTTDPVNNPPTSAQLQRQREVFEQLLRAAIEVPGVKAFLLWDAVDDQSWLHPTTRPLGDVPAGTYFFPAPFSGGDAAGLRSITAKPAYAGMQAALQNPTAPPPSTTLAPGTYRIASRWQPSDGYLGREAGGQNAAGTYVAGPSVGLFALNAETSQWTSLQWRVQPDAAGGFRIAAGWGPESGLLTGNPVGNPVGVSAPLSEAAGGARQRWFIDAVAGGGYRLRNAAPSAVNHLSRSGVATAEGGFLPGRGVYLDHLNADWSSQVWMLERVTP